MKETWHVGLLLAIPSWLLSGCMTGYLVKQGVAQLRVLTHRVPVEDALPDLDEDARARIAIIQEAKTFARDTLGLPVENVYETYSGVHPDPIWNISACPKDRLEPYTWRYPLVGRLPYIGFYNREDAEKERQRLLDMDLDVMMYGAGAFSSLGWFSDPIVPSMLRYRPDTLVNVVIHESAHRYLYFRGRAEFNESFASFVGDVGAIRFFEQRDGPDHPNTRRARGLRSDARTFETFLQGVLEDLETLYADPDLSRDEKLAEREKRFHAAQEAFLQLPLETDAYARFASEPLDNARLLAMRRYGRQALFDRLLEACHGDLGAAMAEVKALDPRKAPRKERRKDLFDRLARRLDQGTACRQTED